MHAFHHDYDEHRLAQRLAVGGSVSGMTTRDERPPAWLVLTVIALVPPAIVLGAAMVAGNFRW